MIAEPPVAGEIEPRNPHAARSLWSARNCASTSSAPSRATLRRMSANACASAPNKSSRLPGRQMAAQILGDRLQLVAERLRPHDFVFHQRTQFRDRIGRRGLRRSRLLAGEFDPVEPGRAEARRQSRPPPPRACPRRNAGARRAASRPRASGGRRGARFAPSHGRSRAPPRSASAPPSSRRRRRDRLRRGGTRRRSSAAPRLILCGRRRSSPARPTSGRPR